MTTRSAQELWVAALGELQIQVSKPNYQTWLEKTVGFTYQANEFVISVPNAFVAEYLDKNQRSLIEKTLIGITGSPDLKVTFQVNGKERCSGKSMTVPSNYAEFFNPRYVFDSFVVGESNHLAWDAALKVAQNPGAIYNPLFICGGVGLGKTHLLHAIGHVAMANRLPVVCASAEQFTNEFIGAVREKNTDEFRNKYRNISMLLIDDIHFISGKEQTEESFFHTFNELHNASHQIVVTSNRPPKALPLIEERLRSRLEWGLVADIQSPDVETRRGILQAKAKQKDFDVPLDVLEFMARRGNQNVRELEGSLNRVFAYCRLLRTPPTVELATQALDNLVNKEPEAPTLTPATVVKVVAESFKLLPDDLTSRKRDKETSRARKVAMYLLRQITNYSVAQIGQELGGRDPSAVTNAYKNVSKCLETSAYLKHKIEDIQQKILNATAKTNR